MPDDGVSGKRPCAEHMDLAARIDLIERIDLAARIDLADKAET